MKTTSSGFSLIELAVVLIIVALLSGGLMTSLTTQREIAANSETQRRLNDARDALLGFAAVNGRLPCPAAPNTTGIESPPGGVTCSNSWDGFLPAVTLGIGPTDANGYALDAWGNPIRYALTTATNAIYCTTHCFATADGVKVAWNNNATLSPYLQICNTATGASGSGAGATCAANATLSNSAVAVIFSRGSNGGAVPTSIDEQANGDADGLFVSHTPTPAGSGNEFDDLVIWISTATLYNRLIAAGRLP